MTIRYRRHYLELAETAEPALRTGAQLHWLRRLDQELDNLRAARAAAFGGVASAQDVGIDEIGLRIAAALWQFWTMRGHFVEGRTCLEVDAVNDFEPCLRSRAHWGAGLMAFAQADFRQAAVLAQASLDLVTANDAWTGTDAIYEVNVINEVKEMNEVDAWNVVKGLSVLSHAQCYFDAEAALKSALTASALAHARGNAWLIASTGIALSHCFLMREQVTDARRCLEESLANARATGDLWLTGTLLISLGRVLQLHADYVLVQNAFSESLAIHRQLGDRYHMGISLFFLGIAAIKLGDLSHARECLRESITIRRTLADTLVVQTLVGFASLALAAEQAERAVRLCGAYDALSRTCGLVASPSTRSELDNCLVRAGSILAAHQVDAAYAEGAILSLDETFSYVLSDGEPDGIGARR